ncbi:MAG: amidohydrolase family protein [Pseudomonadota bacterium]
MGHGQDRLHYAITPRFAPACSDAQLALAGRLAAEFPDALVHTHLAEHPDEVAWVARLFPESRSYLDVYRTAGLLRERAVFAHCLHLDDTDCGDLATAGAAAAFCPSSNLFLGSGLFDLARLRGHGARVGLATDVGAGTSLSLLRTAGEAYKVLQLKGQPLPAWRGLYLATLGAAEALYMDDFLGNFRPGKEADFIVLDAGPNAALAARLAATDGLAEVLFVQFALGDERSVAATYILGECRYQRP